MTDTRTLAFCNLHAILGSLPLLCALDPRALFERAKAVIPS